MTLVATEARQRVYGLTVAQSADEDAGTVLGRMWLRQAISRLQCDAGKKYLEKYEAAMKAIKAPVGLRVTNSAGDGGDTVTEEYVDWATKAVGEYETLKAALEDVRAESSVRYVVILDTDPPDWMLPALHDGLNMLVVKLGLRAA